MEDPQRHSETGAEQPAAGMPRWVKVFLLAVLVAGIVIVIVMLMVGGEHGPGRHTAGTLPRAERHLDATMQLGYRLTLPVSIER